MPQSYYYSDLESSSVDSTNWARVHDIDPTAASTVYDSSPDYYTDVTVFDQHYDDYCNFNWSQKYGDGGGSGLATCNYITSAKNCESADVRYNLNWTDGASALNDHILACHENGHALGLAHPDTTAEMIGKGCMNMGTGVQYYTSHDKSHLTAAFG